jgi:hypothetical protein
MERRSQLGKFKQQRALSGRFFEVGVADLFLKSRKKGGSFDERRAPSSAVQAQDPFAPRAVSLRLSHSCVGAQLTSHLGKLKVRELCLAAFAAAWAIDGNARRSSAG